MKNKDLDYYCKSLKDREVKSKEDWEGLCREMINKLDQGYKEKVKTLSNILINDFLPELNRRGVNIGDTLFSPQHLADLAHLVYNGEISRTTSKKVLNECIEDGLWPTWFVDENNLRQINDPSVLKSIVSDILVSENKMVEQYIGGKEKVLGAIVGKAMGKTKGKANPALLKKLFEKVLNEKKETQMEAYKG